MVSYKNLAVGNSEHEMSGIDGKREKRYGRKSLARRGDLAVMRASGESGAQGAANVAD